MLNKDMIVKNSEDNLQSYVDDLGIKSEYYNKLTNNELVLPFEKSIRDSGAKSDHLLNPLRNGNNEDCMPHDNILYLPVINNSREFETMCSTIATEQENRDVLSGNREEMCAEDLIRRICGPEGSSSLSVECTQYDEINERKMERKQKNKKRKRRSTEEDIERLQAEYVHHTA
jgi:hypothetical protein